MSVNITCPSCKNNLELEGSEQDWGGQVVVCPKCSQDIPIPRTTPSIDVTCPSCSTVLELAPPAKEWIGKIVMCPSCNSAFTFISASKTCPGCRKTMEAGAVVCVSCGLDLKTGSRPHVAARTPQGQQQQINTLNDDHTRYLAGKEIVHCEYCGVEIYDDVLVCPNCHRDQATGEEDNTRFWHVSTYTPQSRGNHGGLIVLLFLGMGLLVYGYLVHRGIVRSPFPSHMQKNIIAPLLQFFNDFLNSFRTFLARHHRQ